jgi:predicted transcriptional regulator
MRTRSRLEIYLDLVRTVSRQGNLVNIGKTVGLSLSDTERHLGFLEFQGFLRIVERKNSKVMYELTPKGFEVLESVRKLMGHEQPLFRHTVSTRVGLGSIG